MAGASILVVEDDSDLGTLILHALSSAGHQCRIAGDTVEALAMVLAGKPALIITDYMMPAGGGSILHKRLRMLVDTRDIPVLFLSSADQNHIMQSVDADRSTYFLAKPYRKDHLLQVVAEILAKSGLS
ncbi:MAG: response regulator [Elusimicrobia bacterium]|nr:response regulator [Elusimicrobiota bacterium]